jgi:hypothetical protein
MHIPSRSEFGSVNLEGSGSWMISKVYYGVKKHAFMVPSTLCNTAVRPDHRDAAIRTATSDLQGTNSIRAKGIIDVHDSNRRDLCHKDWRCVLSAFMRLINSHAPVQLSIKTFMKGAADRDLWQI